MSGTVEKPIQSRFAHLVGNEDHADFWFVIKQDGVRIPAHKTIVGACSTVLNNVVYGSDSGFVVAVDQSEVDEISVVAFMEVLRYMYTDNLTITIQNVAVILKKANYYGLDILQQKCSTFLFKNINRNTCLAFFADLYGLLPIDNLAAQKSLEFITLQPLAAFENRLWTALDSEAVRLILSSDVINCDEYTLFAALLQWFKARRQWDSESNLKSLVENLKNCIRWTTLSLDEFNHINTLEVDFLTQAERHEIADIIRGGCSVLAKRRLWFWKHARWVPTDIDLEIPMPTDAVFIPFDDHSHASYVSRTENDIFKHDPVDDEDIDVEVLCGSGYKWVRITNHIIPENMVATGFKDIDGEDHVVAMSKDYMEFISITSLMKVTLRIDSIPFPWDCSDEYTDYENLLVLVGTTIESDDLPQTEIPPDAIRIETHYSHPTYLGRVYIDGDILPANIIPAEERALAPFNCTEHSVNVYSFLRLTPDTFEWIESANGRLVPKAVEGGRTYYTSELLYFGRTKFGGIMYYGKVHPSHKCLYYGRFGRENSSRHYEVLVYKHESQ